MLEIEQKIMEEIGLGGHYNFYNGSGSCAFIRENAVNKLRAIIQRHVDNGEEISPLTPNCSAYIGQAKQKDTDNYVLTNTWIAIQNVLRYLVEDYQNKKSKEIVFLR